MAKLALSAFADEYSDDFRKQTEILNTLGIGYIELRHADGENVSEMSVQKIKQIGKSLSDSGIKVSSIGSPLGKISIDGDLKSHLDTARRVCETAARLGAKYVRIFSFYIPENVAVEDCRPRVCGYLAKLIDIADEYRVKLCHENEALIYGESPGRCLELIEEFGGKLGCVFDMGNFVLDGYPPYPEAYNLLKEHITYFHIKDALAAGAVVPAGKGEARIKEILDDYRKSGPHDAFITLEPHLQTFAGLNALVGKNFDNPYKYENAEEAFKDAYGKLEELL